MSGVISGRVIRVGDDVNTDLILPGAYLNLTEPEQLGAHLLEGYDVELGTSVEPGDVIVAGHDFGAGSSREQALVAIQARGVSAVVAASFARIFLRNAINLGLPVFESAEAYAAATAGETITIDPEAGRLTLDGGAREFSVPPHPEFVRELLDDGGLVPWVRRRLGVDR